jgi:hypothetical protein
MSCNNTDTDNCGCSHQHSAKCSFYYGDALACIDVVYGDDLQTVIENINTAVCNLTPSGSVAIVESCDLNIDVTPVTVGQTTTYTVCLNSDITDNIQTNSDNISTINTCLSNTVADLTSSDGSVTITEVSSDACGRVLDLTTTTPSGTVSYEGIIYNDITKDGCSNGTTTQELKSFPWDYENNNLIAEGDEIRFRATGQLSKVEVYDIVKVEVWDSGISMLYGESFDIASQLQPITSWTMDGCITKGSSTDDALLQVNIFSSSVENGVKAKLGNNLSNINEDLTGVVWNNLEIKILYVHNSDTAPASTNFARQLMVEVRKKIV